MVEENSRTIDATGARGVLIKDAIILKKGGHESEPVIVLDRLSVTEFGNITHQGNELPLIDPKMIAMNEVRNFIRIHREEYRSVVATFAGMEKAFHGEVRIHGEDEYGMHVLDCILISLTADDNSIPFRPTRENRIKFDNCVILTESRVNTMPETVRNAIAYLQQNVS